MKTIRCDAVECRFQRGGLCTLDEISIYNHYLAGPVCASHRYRNETAGTETTNAANRRRGNGGRA